VVGGWSDAYQADKACWDEYFDLRGKYSTIGIDTKFDLDQLTQLGLALQNILNKFGSFGAFNKAFGGLWIGREDWIRPLWNADGFTPPGLNQIWLADTIFTRTDSLFKIIHEFGHAFDFKNHGLNGNAYNSQQFVDQFNQGGDCYIGVLGCISGTGIYQEWYILIYGDTQNTWNPIVGVGKIYGTTSYGTNASIEDYAESFAAYILGPSSPVTVDRARLAIIQNDIDSYKNLP
jgi:hypothetical protein